MKIRTKLITLACVIAAVFAAIIGMMYFRTSSVLSVIQDDDAMKIVGYLNDTVDVYMAGLENIADDAAPFVARILTEGSPAEREDLAAALAAAYNAGKSRGIIDVYLGVEEDGTIISGNGWTAPAGYDTRVQDWYKSAVAAKKTFLTEPYEDEDTKEIVLSVVAPVYSPDGKVLGVLGADVYLEGIGSKIRDATVFGAGYGLLLAPDGIVLEHPDKTMVAKENLSKTSSRVTEELAALGKRMITHEKGSGTYTLDGADRMIYYASGDYNYIAALVFPHTQWYAIVRSVTLLQTVIGIIAAILVVICMAFLIVSITKPLRAVMVTINRMADLDLTADHEAVKTVARLSPDTELGAMVAATRKMRDAFIDIISAVRGDVVKLASSSGTLDDLSRSATDDVSDSKKAAVNVQNLADEALRSVEATASAVGEVTHAATMTATSATEGAEASSVTSQLSASVSDMVNAFVDDLQNVGDASLENRKGMTEVGESVEAIGEFVTSIRNIASQTNLLALNAAIEAARAGDAGRGFAVVADEVRKLAEESNVASLHVAELMEKLQAGTQNAIGSAQRSSETISGIIGKARETQDSLRNALTQIDKVNDAVQTIAAAAEEQAASSNEIAESTNQTRDSIGNVAHEISTITSATDETMNAIKKVAGEAEILSSISADLENLMARFVTEESERQTRAIAAKR